MHSLRTTARAAAWCMFLGSALAMSAFAQEREVELLPEPPTPRPTTPGTYRDPTASAISTLKSEIDVMATTEIEKLSRMSRAGTTARIRAMQYRQQVRLVRTMNQVSKKWYVKGLGVATFLADSGATVLGHLYEKNYQSAAVAATDEGAKFLSASTGAWAFGKAGAGIGTFFGGPPGAMIGGGVGAIVGAVVGTVGYNAYVSPTMTYLAETAIEPDYFEMALKNREEHLYEEELARILRETMGEQSTTTATETAPPPLRLPPWQPPLQPPEFLPPEAAPPAQPPVVVDNSYPWLYQGIWLPEKYFPAGFRRYESDPVPKGDPPQTNGTQSVWYGIPLKSKGGKSSSSAGEHPYTVFIDGITVYKSEAMAREHLQMGRQSLKANTAVALGDEAYADDDYKGDDGSIFKEYKGDKGVRSRNICIRYARVGRVVFGLRVSGDRVMDFNPNGQSHADFVAHPTPSRDDIMRTAQTFVASIRQYAKDKNWLQD